MPRTSVFHHRHYIHCDFPTNIVLLSFTTEETQSLTLSLTTGEYTGQGQICVNGVLGKAGFNLPFNIGIVIDAGYSTNADPQDTPTADMK